MAWCCSYALNLKRRCSTCEYCYDSRGGFSSAASGKRCKCVRMYVCMCMYIHIYLYVNTHIHVCAQVRRYEILFLWYSAFYTHVCTPLLQVSGLMHVLLSKYRHRYACHYLHHYFAFVFVRLYLYVSTSKGIICKGIYLSLGTSFNHPHI